MKSKEGKEKGRGEVGREWERGKREGGYSHTFRDIENIAGSLFDYFGYSRVTSDAQQDKASVFYRV
jgi:hypothetical protein